MVVYTPQQYNLSTAYLNSLRRVRRVRRVLYCPGRQPGNNDVLQWWGPSLERYERACQKLMDKFRNVIPEGCTKAKIKATRRDALRPREETLGSTLGEECTGYVTVDPDSGRVMRYDEMKVMSQIVAAPASSVELRVQDTETRRWKRVGLVETQQDADLDEQWKNDLHQGTEHVKNSFVRHSDPHLDARVFIAKHPYGTGSCFAEPGSGRPQKYVISRLTSIEQWFRRNSQWGFFQLDRLIKSKLFWHKRSKAKSTGQSQPAPKTQDIYETLYGSVQPACIPESTAWCSESNRNAMQLEAASILPIQKPFFLSGGADNPRIC